MFKAIRKRWADAGVASGLVALTAATQHGQHAKIPKIVGTLQSYQMEHGVGSFILAAQQAVKNERNGTMRMATLTGLSIYCELTSQPGLEDEMFPVAAELAVDVL